MYNVKTQLIKSVVFAAVFASSAMTVSPAVSGQTITDSLNTNPWNKLSLGNCKVQTSHAKHAFLYCQGAPNRRSTAVIDTIKLSSNQVQKMQCHTSLNARQVTCFAPNLKVGFKVQHLAIIDTWQYCPSIAWQSDNAGNYQLGATACASQIGLTDFKTATANYINPAVVNFNGELLIDSAASYDGCDKTSMGDDTDKTSMGDDTDKTSMGDDTDKTSMGDDTDKYTLSGCKTSMGDDTDKTSMGDDN